MKKVAPMLYFRMFICAKVGVHHLEQAKRLVRKEQRTGHRRLETFEENMTDELHHGYT